MADQRGALEYLAEQEEFQASALSCINYAARAMRGERVEIDGHPDEVRATYWLNLAQVYATLANAVAVRLMVECYDGHNTSGVIR